ncbi:MAG: dihydroneopterin aldolase [Gammaproteobacteria bacterium]|nr:dihydroneopterin aldolase [Gammaproteobacteria bacterium]
MDIVYIRGLKIDTIIGIYDWEREQKQTISIDLEMATDISAAAHSEDIEKALDYKKVAKRLIAFIEPSEFLLIETMAEKIAQLVMDEFKVPWLRLQLGKPGAVTGADDVGVVIERGDKSRPYSY